MSAQDDLVRCRDLSHQQRLEAARLASQALTILYDDVPGIVPVLAAEFSMDGTELAEARALAGAHVDGLVACYPANEYEARQRNSLHHALRSLPGESALNFIQRLRDLSAEIPKAGLKGHYLARFAVRPAVRGSGTADRLMDLLVTQHSVLTLHVRADNHRAMKFYARYGFAIVAEGTQTLLMQRS